MSASPDFVTYITELISPLGRITTKRMFGGAMLSVNGQQLGIIINDLLYLRIPKELHEKYQNHGSVPFQYDKKDSTVIVKAWWTLPDICIDNQENLLIWARECLEKSSK
jgi:DNA transformation protein